MAIDEHMKPWRRPPTQEEWDRIFGKKDEKKDEEKRKEQHGAVSKKASRD